MPEDKQLTGKQAAFVEEYCKSWNATQAAIKAGYSEHTARSIGHENLTKPAIAAEIEIRRQEYLTSIGITKERVLLEYGRIAFADPRKALTPGGHLLPPHEWDDDTAAAIGGIEVVTSSIGAKDEENRAIVEHTHKIKNWDKGRALEAIGKHLGMFVEKKEIDLKGLTVVIGDKDADCC